MSTAVQRRFPIGAEFVTGGVHFRVWAPRRKHVRSHLFAPTHLYGTPDDFRALVDRAHALGLGVVLDVVYNHLGPDGNYLKQFSEAYFTARHVNEWGEALNFDGPGSGPVREFFQSNAAYWIEEFHLDGLRLDATQQIFDNSSRNILTDIHRDARRAAAGRSIVMIGENEGQDARIAQPLDKGGYGMDAIWNDDFHHSAHVAVTGRSEAYYTDYCGTPQEFISMARQLLLSCRAPLLCEEGNIWFQNSPISRRPFPDTVHW